MNVLLGYAALLAIVAGIVWGAPRLAAWWFCEQATRDADVGLPRLAERRERVRR